MGKVTKVRRYRRRFKNFFVFCCCGARPVNEDEQDIYEKKPDKDDKLGYNEIEEIFENEIIYENDDEDEDAGSGTDESSAGGSNTSSEISLPLEDQETPPKRPVSFNKDDISPRFELHRPDSGEWKILRCLGVQSEKLDRILGKLDDELQNVDSLRQCVQGFHNSVNRYSRLYQQTIRESPGDRVQESQCFTYPTVPEMREATEHEHSEIPTFSTETEQSEESVSLLRFSSETTTSPKSTIFSTLSRVPTEHDDSSSDTIERTPEKNSSCVAQIVRDQFDALQRCAKEHASICKNKAEEVCEVVSEMQTQIDSLTGLPETPVTRRPNAEVLRSRSFVRCSYPSPIRQGRPGDTEIIELKNLSPR